MTVHHRHGDPIQETVSRSNSAAAALAAQVRRDAMPDPTATSMPRRNRSRRSRHAKFRRESANGRVVHGVVASLEALAKKKGIDWVVDAYDGRNPITEDREDEIAEDLLWDAD